MVIVPGARAAAISTAKATRLIILISFSVTPPGPHVWQGQQLAVRLMESSLAPSVGLLSVSRGADFSPIGVPIVTLVLMRQYSHRL